MSIQGFNLGDNFSSQLFTIGYNEINRPVDIHVFIQPPKTCTQIALTALLYIGTLFLFIPETAVRCTLGTVVYLALSPLHILVEFPCWLTGSNCFNNFFDQVADFEVSVMGLHSACIETHPAVALLRRDAVALGEMGQLIGGYGAIVRAGLDDHKTRNPT